jgi:hypothetical protein
VIELVDYSPAHFDWDSEWVIDVRSGIVTHWLQLLRNGIDMPVMVLDGWFYRPSVRLKEVSLIIRIQYQ